ncbi:MAG: ABC transporter ATP-binding protein [Verrucomicrobiota bacterium]
MPWFLAMAGVMLQVQGLTKEFGDFTAVDRLSFEIEAGEIVGLLGVNGAGKTTAINMILGLVEPSSGEVSLFGEDFKAKRVEILRRTNYSSSYTDLPGNLRVWQNLLVFGKLYGVPDIRGKTDEVLELFEISHLRNRVTGELSAGESTRVNLCKALLNDPELLMLDEPTASLDPDIADKVRKVIRRVRDEKGMGVLYTSHNMRDVEEVCDRVIFMHKGKVLCEGTPEEIVKRFQEDSLEEVFIRVARGGDFLEEIVDRKEGGS